MASPVGSDDAPVQIMTIHKAKGLEFDVVIVPDLQSAARRRADRRLLYWTTIATGPGRARHRPRQPQRRGRGGRGRPMRSKRWMRKLEARARRPRARPPRLRRRHARPPRAAPVGNVRDEADRGRATCCSSRAAASLLAIPLAGGVGRVRARARGARGRSRSARAGPAAAYGAAARRACRPPGRRRSPNRRRAPRCLRILGERRSPIRPDFDWAGAIAQAVGEVVHVELQRLARAGGATRGADARGRAAMGPPAALRRAWTMRTCREALARTRPPSTVLPAAASSRRSCSTRRRAMRPANSRSPAMIDGVAAGPAHRPDLRGRRRACAGSWTGRRARTKAAIADAFLDNELERYRGQLERYAHAMKLLEPDRELKVGLYFPLLDAWRGL